MADKLQLTLQINAETGQLEVVGQKMNALAGTTRSLASEAGSLLKAFLPFATIGGVVAFFSGAVKEAEEAGQAVRRLEFAVNALGSAAKTSKGQIQSWAEEIQKSTRFSDTQAVVTLEKLVRITGDFTQAQKAANLAMSLSVASGKSLEESTQLVTNLINGNRLALIEARREFGAFIGNARTFQEALTGLSKNLGDAAFKEEGLTKQTLHLSNEWHTFKQGVGEALTGPLTNLLAWFNEMPAKIDRVTIYWDALQQKIAFGSLRIAAAISHAFTFNVNGVVANLKAMGAEFDKINQITALKLQLSEKKKTDIVKQESLKRTDVVRKENLAEVQAREAAGLQVADLAAQTFAVLNSMGEKHNQAEVDRAKAILALEKSITIARAIAEAQKGGPLAGAIAAASIALITAQFAQQSRAIDSAQKQFSQSNAEASSAAAPVGNGLGDRPGSGVGFPSGGGGGGGGGTVVGPSGGGVGTGAIVVNVNANAIVVNGSIGVDDIAAKIGRKIVEDIKARGQSDFVGVA